MLVLHGVEPRRQRSHSLTTTPAALAPWHRLRRERAAGSSPQNPSPIDVRRSGTAISQLVPQPCSSEQPWGGVHIPAHGCKGCGQTAGVAPPDIGGASLMPGGVLLLAYMVGGGLTHAMQGGGRSLTSRRPETEVFTIWRSAIDISALRTAVT